MTLQASENALHSRDGQKSLQNTLVFPPCNEKRISVKVSNMKKSLSRSLVRPQRNTFRLHLPVEFLAVVCSLGDMGNRAATWPF